MSGWAIFGIAVVAWLALLFLMGAARKSLMRLIDGTLGRDESEGPTGGPWSAK